MGSCHSEMNKVLKCAGEKPGKRKGSGHSRRGSHGSHKGKGHHKGRRGSNDSHGSHGKKH